jgi:hypothetical protein
MTCPFCDKPVSDEQVEKYADSEPVCVECERKLKEAEHS